MSSLCDDDHKENLTGLKRVVKKKDFVVDVDKNAGGTESVNIQQVSDKAMASPDVTGDRLGVRHARLAHANRNAIKKMA